MSFSFLAKNEIINTNEEAGLEVGHSFQVSHFRRHKDFDASHEDSKEPSIFLSSSLLKTKGHLHIDFLIFPKSSMKKCNSDMSLFRFQSMYNLKDKHEAKSDPLDNRVIGIKEINSFKIAIFMIEQALNFSLFHLEITCT